VRVNASVQLLRRLCSVIFQNDRKKCKSRSIWIQGGQSNWTSKVRSISDDHFPTQYRIFEFVSNTGFQLLSLEQEVNLNSVNRQQNWYFLSIPNICANPIVCVKCLSDQRYFSRSKCRCNDLYLPFLLYYILQLRSFVTMVCNYEKRETNKLTNSITLDNRNAIIV